MSREFSHWIAQIANSWTEQRTARKVRQGARHARRPAVEEDLAAVPLGPLTWRRQAVARCGALTIWSNSLAASTQPRSLSGRIGARMTSTRLQVSMKSTGNPAEWTWTATSAALEMAVMRSGGDFRRSGVAPCPTGTRSPAVPPPPATSLEPRRANALAMQALALSAKPHDATMCERRQP
jgi:hypothetical protein